MVTPLVVHEIVGEFADVATRGTIEGILFFVGALLVGLAVGVVGFLTLGGLLAALRRPSG